MLFVSSTVVAIALLTPIAVSVAVDLPNWITNATIQSLIGAIFDEIERVDIVVTSDAPKVIDQLDYLARRQGDAILQRKSIRIYGQVFPFNEEKVCTSNSPILRDLVKLDELSGAIDRDYEDEFQFIHWDRSYESFAKIWDQNQDGGYVIFAGMNTFESLMRCLLDPKGTYLVVLELGEKFDWDEVSHLTGSIWNHAGVYRLFFLATDEIYAFDPFLNNGTGYGVLKKLTNALDYPSVPTSNFNGYPLKIDMFGSTYAVSVLNKNKTTIGFLGADVEVSRAFSKALNFTPIYFLHTERDNFGALLPNGSFSGVIGRLSRHESDISFVGFFIKDYFNRDIEFTTGLYIDEMCCLVKKASRVPEYLLPITIFPRDLWGLLLLVGILFSVSWIVIRAAIRAKSTTGVNWKQRRRLAYLFNLSNDIRDAPTYRKMVQIVIDTFILWVSAPFQRFTRSGIERLMLFGMMLVSVIFVSMFQSSLSSIYLNPVYYKDINSLEQLDQSGFKIPVKYQGYLDDIFAGNYSPMMTSLRNKMVLVPSTTPLLDHIVSRGTIATVTRRSTLSLGNAIYITTKQIYMVPECPRLYNLAYVVPRHSVLLERINIVLSWMLNGGLINRWISEMNYNVTMKDWQRIRSTQGSDFKVLTLIDLQFPFYLLAIGLVLSGVTFVVELMYHRRI